MQGRLENEIKIQQSIDDLMRTLPTFANEWYINMKASRKTASSCLDFARKIKKFLEYVNPNPKNMNASEITLQACESYCISCQTKTNENGMIVYTSDSYQCGVWCAMNSLLTFLHKRNYIDHNYMEDICRPKNKDLDRINNERIFLTQKDFNKIIKSAKKENKFMDGVLYNRNILIILLFMTTGMRETALTEINIEDINFKDNVLKVVDKGNKTHIYVLNEQVLQYLHLWLDDRKRLNNDESSTALFINRDGNRMSSHGVSKLVKKICNDAIGKDLSPHKLRSGFCSILYNKTHDVEFVRRAVGHSNIQTTQRYIKTDDKEKEKAVQIMSGLLDM